MMDIETQDPQTQTKLRIGTDRSFGQPTGESVLRVSGQGPDGSQVVDFAAVELNGLEASATAKLWRNVRTPDPDYIQTVTQEVIAAFPAKLSGRDARTIAQIVSRAAQMQAAAWFGEQPDQPERAYAKFDRLAERLERAAGLQSQPVGGGTVGEQEQSAKQQQGK